MDGRIGKSSPWHFCCRSHKITMRAAGVSGFCRYTSFFPLACAPGSLVGKLHSDPDYFDAGHRFVVDAFDVLLPFREKD